VQDPLEQLTNRPFSTGGSVTSLFRTVGVHDFVGAARHILKLPYGRIADRSKFWLVLEEAVVRARPNMPSSLSLPGNRRSTWTSLSASTR